MAKKEKQTDETKSADAAPKKRAPKRAVVAKTPTHEEAPAAIPTQEHTTLELLTEETLLQFEFSPDAIALRAYFLAEKRREQGLHPDPVSDWLVAEGEILAALEASARPAKKTTRTRKTK